jgi:OOP family OmpA-OmpF porin
VLIQQGQHIYFSRGVSNDDTDIFRFKADDIFIDPDSPLMASVSHLTASRADEFFRYVYGKVIDEGTSLAVADVDIILERLPDGVDMGKVKSNAKGEYRMSVRGGAKYGLNANLNGYLSTGMNFDLNSLKRNDTLNVDMLLSKIKVGAKVVLNNIFFDFDKVTLQTSSYPEMSRLVELMKSGGIQKVEVSGHTDSVGDEVYNQKLSERRAQAVVNYMRKSGISDDRVIAVGYGETKPIAENDTKENRSKNRRVEFKIFE